MGVAVGMSGFTEGDMASRMKTNELFRSVGSRVRESLMIVTVWTLIDARWTLGAVVGPLTAPTGRPSTTGYLSSGSL